MGAARGVAGSTRPEAAGIFLSSDQWDVEYFVRMNNTGGPVDVWQIDGVGPEQMVDYGNGYLYLPGVIPADQLMLVQRDLAGGDLYKG
jgi:hypothetical protein